VLSLIAKIEITDHGHRAADLAEGCDPKDTAAGICPSRFRGCLRKSVPAVHPLRRRGTNVVAARRYVTSLRTADSVLATDSQHLVALREYISKDSEQSAALVATRILDAIELLQTQPEMGRPGRVVGTRELVIPDTPYIIPYRIRNERLELIAVFHGRQRWPKKL
jgi:toxin ParE1/3/4